MRELPTATAAALCWYALLLLLRLPFGEAVFFPWPHLFMMWLGLESNLGLAFALGVGGLAIVAAGIPLRRFTFLRPARLLAAMATGLVLAAVTLIVLLVAAWVVATLAGWPTSA